MSKPYKVRFAESFFTDIEEIFKYIEVNFGQALAQKIISNIYREISERLANNPNLGRRYIDDDFYRYFFIAKRKDIVFYHVEGSEIVIYRIFDSRRDYARLLES